MEVRVIIRTNWVLECYQYIILKEYTLIFQTEIPNSQSETALWKAWKTVHYFIYWQTGIHLPPNHETVLRFR